MKYRDVLRFSLRGIRTSPLRSALSALSVAVGTGALLIIASLGLFGRTQIENGLARIGVSGLAVSTDEGGAGTPLSAALAERMAQAVPGIKAASPVRAVGGTVRAGHRTSGVVLLGADENLGEVMQVELLAGALPSQAQVESRAAVAVVGDDLAERLYGRVNITGREIRISRNGREQIFTVCGVMRAQTGALGGALSAIAPELVYVPLRDCSQRAESAPIRFSCRALRTPIRMRSDAVSRAISKRAVRSPARFMYGAFRARSRPCSTSRHSARCSSSLSAALRCSFPCSACSAACCPPRTSERTRSAFCSPSAHENATSGGSF